MSRQLTTELTSPVKVNNDIADFLLKKLISRRKPTEEDLVAALEVTTDKVLEETQAEAITFFLLDQNNNINFSHIFYHDSLFKGDEKLKEKYEEKIEFLKKQTIPKGKGIVGKVIESGESDLVVDAQKDKDHLDMDKDTGFITHSMITVPLKTKEVFGAIQILNKRAGEPYFSEEDKKLLESVADYSAKIIKRVKDPDFLLSSDDIALYISQLARIPLIDPAKDVEIEEKLFKIIGEPVLKRYLIIPIKQLAGDNLRVAMTNPFDIQKRDTFEATTKMKLAEITVASEEKIRSAIEKIFPKDSGIGDIADAVTDAFTASAEVVEMSEDADEDSTPMIQLANRIIEDAYARGSSDIHVEPGEKELLIRYRIDGALQEVLRLPPTTCRALAARYKIMSELDIAERRLPQDGRIQFKHFSRAGIDIDLRVSVAPNTYGEKLVMRILDKQATAFGLEHMGFSATNLVEYRAAISKPYGMILHVGPTGSGKTTTLYAALNEVVNPQLNIQTAEDPVEYQINGINQMQMHAKIGLTFARALRCFLRQDPDIIMVGEIRDEETAGIAIEAALTGHLLFSTAHTNDAVGTVTRFEDMGIEPFLISSSMVCVCAQRLLRKLCKCKLEYDAEEKELEALGISPEEGKGLKLFKAKGCEKCNGSGYKGRMGVHELFLLTDNTRVMINQKIPITEVKQQAIKDGMIPIYNDCMEKVAEGISSLEEGLMTVTKD